MKNIIEIVPFNEHRVIEIEVSHLRKRWDIVRRLCLKPPAVLALIDPYSPYSTYVGPDLINPDHVLHILKFKLLLYTEHDLPPFEAEDIESHMISYDFGIGEDYWKPPKVILSAYSPFS